MSLTEQNFVLPLALATDVLFGIFALVMFYRFTNSALGKNLDTEFFLTARDTQPWYRIGWGLFAQGIGSGVITGAPIFSITGSGWISLITYPLSSGLPILLGAYMGDLIRNRYSRPLSIANFAQWRYGKFYQVYVTLNVLLNLGVAMAVEYTTIGALFNQFLFVPAYVPIIVVGIVTMTYTILGGLYVSIITDQVQTLFVLTMMLVTSIYLGVNFRPGQLPALDPFLGATDAGYATIATLPIALISSTIFSDAFWQRVWAAKSGTDLKKGAWLGAILASFVTLYFGIFGYFAAWLNLLDPNDPGAVNTAFFAILRPEVTAAVPIGMLAVVFVLAATLNESATDSYQNAILDTVVSCFMSFGIKVPLSVARLLVVLINVPLMYIGTQNYNIIALFLVTNQLTTCSVLPLCMGLFKVFDGFVSEGAVLFGSIFAFFSVLVHGYITYGNVVDGLTNFFFSYTYQWQPFINGLVSSVVGVFLYAGVERLVRNAMGLEQYKFVPIEEPKGLDEKEFA
ncbi:hypothetical protein EDD86DRAFT_92409 [Gorgonomyces haynaldii]|nr:hypothetical protein EDD86DRAFT_92409 [Gorgonomyces haynaldii]